MSCRPSYLLVLILVASQICGPSVLWAAEQRGIRIETSQSLLISGLNGDALTARSAIDSKKVGFGEPVGIGDDLTTGNETSAEILIGNQAVLALDRNTMAQVASFSDNEIAFRVSRGSVRVAAAASALGERGKVLIHTPSRTIHTGGGIVRVQVDAPTAKADSPEMNEARPYRASYSPSVAAMALRNEIVHVEEGTAEIVAAGKAAALTIPAGQGIRFQGDQAESVTTFIQQGMVGTGLLANKGHVNTPKEGLAHLVTLQANQAAALGNALTGASESGGEGSGQGDQSKNAVIGSTGGVTLASNPSLVNALFGTGTTASVTSGGTTNVTGAGYGGNNNNGFGAAQASGLNVNLNGGNALLVFTRKDPVQSIVKEDITIITQFFTASYAKDQLCNFVCLQDHNDSTNFSNIGFRALTPVRSQFEVAKELVLIGGTPNTAHGGIAPTETLIVRGAAPTGTVTTFTNLASTTSGFSANGLYPTDRFPADIGLFAPTPAEITSANSTFVVQTPSTFVSSAPGAAPNFLGGPPGSALVGGTLGQYSNVSTPSPNGIAIDQLGNGVSHVDGAITSTGSNVVLRGGVTLDRATVVTISTTAATNSYFASIGGNDTKYTGSLLSIIDGPIAGQQTKLTVNDRLLGVYDGSRVATDGGDKALLSVLDARLIGPAAVPLIDIDAAFADDGISPGTEPSVAVTSAIVTRSTKPLDGALLIASAPLLALTNATMTTTSHFADLAGNTTQALNLNGAMIAMRAATLTVNGNLLNLNNANATLNGYLFSLTDGSRLTLNGGSLFNLAGTSSLTLNTNAFGVFGAGANTLSIQNQLCVAGCFNLVNSVGTPFTTPSGTTLKVAGVTQNVVLPNTFSPFALAPGATTQNATLDIHPQAAVFQVGGSSTLTINGVKVR